MDVELDGSKRIYLDAESAQLECCAKVMMVRVTFATRVGARRAFLDLQSSLESKGETKIILHSLGK